ncbi:MAG: glycosyltransferase family 2 protein [Candidatus Aenigmatarchaeota archaeon]
MMISIIVATINRGSLVKTLESIAKQTYKDFEVIITDDTNGKARKIVEEFKKNYPEIRIKYVINQKYVKGPGGNKNNGLDYAEGEFITFVDDDDELLPEAIETAIKQIEEKDLDVFLANCMDNVKGEKTGLSYGVSEYITYYDFLKGKYDGEYFGVSRRALIGYDRFPDHAWGAEIVLWFKVFKKAKKIYYLDEALKIYNVAYDDRVTFQMTKFPKRQALNYYYLINAYFQDFKNQAPKQLLRYTLQGIYFSRLAKDLNLSLYFLKKSLKGHFLLFLISFAYFSFCWMLPRGIISFVKEKLFKNLTPFIKRLLR